MHLILVRLININIIIQGNLEYPIYICHGFMYTYRHCREMLDALDGASNNRPSRDNGTIGRTRRRQNKNKQTKHNTES